MSSKTPSRVVFVGNIPYGLSEEQISELFSSAGQVLNFRLVYDRDTGRPKGFGFAEYPDADSAASAVRNLNDHEIMGRKLRVDFSNEGGAGGNDDSGYHHERNQSSSVAHAYNSNPSDGVDTISDGGSLPPLPPGAPLPPGITISDHISRVLNTLPPTQLLDILASMKQHSVSDPSRAAELLNQAPQLSYAVFQSLLLMGLVGPEAVNAVLEPGTAPPPIATFPPAVGGYPGIGAIATTPQVVPAAYAPLPSVAPMPTPAAQPVAQPPTATVLPEQNALIQQVLSLPEEVIQQLPEQERAQIMALRAQYTSMR